MTAVPVRSATLAGISHPVELQQAGTNVTAIA